MAGAFVTSRVGTVPLTPDATKPARRVLHTPPTMCWAAYRIDLTRNGVYAAEQFGLLVAGAVLSVALFVSGAVGQS